MKKEILSALSIISLSFQFASAQWVTSSNGANISNSNSGDVSIGTADPTAKLTIYEPNNRAGFKVQSTEAGMTWNRHALTLTSSPSFSQVPYIEWIDPEGKRQAYQGWERNYFNLTLQNGFNYSINGGRVGIGTTSPETALHVNGISRANLIDFYEGESLLGFLGRGSSYTGGWSDQPNTLTLTYTQRDFAIGGWSKTAGSWMGPAFFINSDNGNVGIGTTTPEFKVDVNGDSRISKTVITNSNSPFPNSSILYSQTGMPSIFGVDGSWTTKYFGLKADGTFITMGGNVGIGTVTPDSRLTVKGNIHAEEVKIDLNVPVPDYVFEKTYDLKSLKEVEKYVATNKHLPEIPSAAQMKEDGVNMGEMQMKLLQKIEELTLHLIEQNKKVEKLEKELKKLKK